MKHLQYDDLKKLAEYLGGKRTLFEIEKASIARRLRAEMADFDD